MVFGLLIAWLALFLFAVVWLLYAMPYQVSIDVFAGVGAFVALCLFIIAGAGKSNVGKPA